MDTSQQTWPLATFSYVFQVPNSITTTPQNSYVPVATNSWVRQLGDHLFFATACHSRCFLKTFKDFQSLSRINESIDHDFSRPGRCWLCYGSKVAPRVVVSSRTHRNCGAHPDRVLCFSTTMIHYVSFIYRWCPWALAIYTVSFCRSDRRIRWICSDSFGALIISEKACWGQLQVRHPLPERHTEGQQTFAVMLVQQEMSWNCS